jgi:hypothetical protein
VEDVLDYGTADEAEAIQRALIDEFSDVLDREEFLATLHKAYVEEGEPEVIVEEF